MNGRLRVSLSGSFLFVRSREGRVHEPSISKAKSKHQHPLPHSCPESLQPAADCCGRTLLPPSAARPLARTLQTTFLIMFTNLAYACRRYGSRDDRGLGSKASRLGFKLSASLGTLPLSSDLPSSHQLRPLPHRRKSRIFPCFCMMFSVDTVLVCLL